VARGAYHIISETAEDRFAEAESLEEARRIVRCVVNEGQAGEPVLIEYQGKAIRQFVLTADGVVEKELLP
jgi:hypothetical protein